MFIEWLKILIIGFSVVGFFILFLYYSGDGGLSAESYKEIHSIKWDKNQGRYIQTYFMPKGTKKWESDGFFRK